MAFDRIRRMLGGGGSPEERRDRERKKELAKTDMQLAAIAPMISFAREPSFFEDHYRIVEVNLEKLMASYRTDNSYTLIDMENLQGDSPRKIMRLSERLINNQGLMHMPAITPNSIYHGKHRMALLERMGVKVVPVLYPIGKGEKIPEEFLEKFGVDKPYYQLRRKAGNYKMFQTDGTFNNVEDVDRIEPIDRAAIMTPPGSYVPHEIPVKEAGSGSEHLDRLKEQGREQGPRKFNPRPDGDEGRT